MRHAATMLLLALALATPAWSAAGEGTALQRVQQYLADLATLRADFRQTVTDAQGRIVERAEGTLALARPGRFRWDYRVPRQEIVCDGTTIWLYDVELEQVTVRAAGTALAGTPAMLLAGRVELSAEFVISDGGSANGLEWSVLAPRSEGDFREIRLGFAGSVLRRMHLADRLGQTTEIDLDDAERNPPLDPALFRFTPPPGVDVVGRVPGD